MSKLREEVEALKEFMQGSSYPGPHPGQLWALGQSFTPAARAMMFPELEKEAQDKKKFKDKYSKKRATLRKLAQWLQQKDAP